MPLYYAPPFSKERRTRPLRAKQRVGERRVYEGEVGDVTGGFVEGAVDEPLGEEPEGAADEDDGADVGDVTGGFVEGAVDEPLDEESEGAADEDDGADVGDGSSASGIGLLSTIRALSSCGVPLSRSVVTSIT